MNINEEALLKDFGMNLDVLRQEIEEDKKKKIKEYLKCKIFLEMVEREVQNSVYFNYNDKERLNSFLGKAKWHCIGKINWLENGTDAFKQD